MATTPIEVLIVDDHRLVAEGLEALLGACPDMRIVGAAGTAAEAVRMADEYAPKVIVMDLRLPDSSGADAAATIRTRHPEVAVVFVTAEDSEEALLAAVGAGGCALLPKSRAAADVATAVRRAAEGEMLISPNRLSALLARIQERARDDAVKVRLLADLTPREKQVLRLMAEGLDSRAIAEHLVISFTTVRGHVQHVLEKLDAHSKLEAVARAARLGLLKD